MSEKIVPSNPTTSVYTLVVYTAPDSTFKDSDAYEQQIYQQATGTYCNTASNSPAHSLTITVPKTYYQIDLVCGLAINQLEPIQNNNAYGPDSANLLYHAQSRYIGGENGGITPPPTNPAPCADHARDAAESHDHSSAHGLGDPLGRHQPAWHEHDHVLPVRAGGDIEYAPEPAPSTPTRSPSPATARIPLPPVP